MSALKPAPAADTSRRAAPALSEVALDRPPSALSMYLQAAASSFKGKKGGSTLPAMAVVLPHVVLDGAHIQRYAAFCGYRPSQGTPPAYLHMLSFPLQMHYMNSPAFPWPVIGSVHLGFQATQHAPVQAGETVRVEVVPGELSAHDKGQVFSLVTNVTRDGVLVWRSVNHYLRMGVRSPQGAPYVSQLGESDSLQRREEWTVDGGIGRRYGRISGDFNPIHLSAPTAKLLGFKRAIAHGMWTMAHALAQVVPPQGAPRLGVQVEFKTPLFLPGKATLWTCSSGEATLFEVRDGAGVKPHLRGKVVLG